MGRTMARSVRFRAQRVLRTADQLLETARIKQKPAWYTSLQKVPPTENLLVRPVKHRIQYAAALTPESETLIPGATIRHGRLRPRCEGEQSSGVGAAHELGGKMRETRELKGTAFKPKRIVYAEDKLRSEFFGDHPWELARPRVVMEMGGGYDARGWDWGKGIEQAGKQLDGESVVQRQSYLMSNPPFPSKAAAYDKARKEFYAVRRRQEVERRVAREEALAVGAIFGPSTIEYGMKLEDAVWDRWRAWAAKTLEMQAMRRESEQLVLGIDPDRVDGGDGQEVAA